MSIKNLIIDDDEIALMLTELLLNVNDFFDTPMKFLSGEHAVDYLKANYSPETYYTIILDINMPFMDGWEFLDKIDTIVSPQNTFVFIVSSSIDEKDMKKSEDYKLVKGYFSKPLKEEHLKRIQELLPKGSI